MQTLLRLLNSGTHEAVNRLVALATEPVPSHELKRREQVVRSKSANREKPPDWFLGCARYQVAALQSPERAKELVTILRTLVDVWINSGNVSNGQHRPRERTLPLEYLGIWRLDNSDVPVPELDLLERPQIERMRHLDPATGVLLERFAAWRKQPHWILEDNGPRLPLSEMAGPRTCAFAIVALLLMSEDGYRIAKCEHCGRYYRTKQLARQKYENGLYCSPGHQNIVSARRAKHAGRDQKNAMFVLAAVAEYKLINSSEQLSKLSREKIRERLLKAMRRKAGSQYDAPTQTLLTRLWPKIVEALPEDQRKAMLKMRK